MSVPEPRLTHGPLDLVQWVAGVTDDRTREFRQAVHTILVAMESLDDGSRWLALKGAVLLSLRYQFTRMTRDVDFSTALRYRDFDQANFLTRLELALTAAVERLPYGLACRCQSVELRPRSAAATYQTLHIRVGYAPKLDARRLARLQQSDGSPTVITIDLSFNEPLCALEILQDGGPITVPAYALSDFIAEKLRAILQQETRNRFRPQDALDVSILLQRAETREAGFRQDVLDSLRTKSAARNLAVEPHSMRNAEIRRRSALDYATLTDQITIPLPPFDETFDTVRSYYEALPWSTS